MFSNLPEYIITIVVTATASSGFWAFLQSMSNKKDARLELLIGLAHDRIVSTGKNYIDRGWLTYDEYEDFLNYLYKPYNRFGGNGLAERVMKEVAALPIRTTHLEISDVIAESRV